MEQVFLVTGVIALLAGRSLVRRGYRADRPLSVFLFLLGAVSLVSAWQRWVEVGLVAASVGLVMLILPSQLAMAAQLARIRGALKASAWWETLAWLTFPGALRRLHRDAARIARDRALGRINREQMVERLRRLDGIVPGAGVLRLNEAMIQAEGALREWDFLLAQMPRDLQDPGAFQGWTMAARGVLLRALIARGRISDAVMLVRGMDQALEFGDPSLACPGDLAEVPEVWRDRLGVEWLAALGEEPGRWLRPFSPLRPLFSRGDRRALARHAAVVRGEGRASWVREAAQMEEHRLARTARLPQFLTSVRAMPPATLGLVLWNLGWLAVLMATGSSVDGTHLFRMGGATPSRVLGPDPWRLVTSMSLHAGPLHFAVNMLFLSYAGGIAERLLGPRILMWTYLVAGMAGGLMAMALGQERVLVGASGAIAGVFGAAGLALWRRRRDLPGRWFRRNLRVFVQTLGGNLLLGLALPMVSLSAHGGGFLGGLVAAGTAKGPGPGRAWASLGVTLACLGAVGFGVVGLHRSLGVPLEESLPMRPVIVRGEGPPSWRLPLEIPITWIDLQEEDPGHPPAFAGTGGQLAAIEVLCGDTWKRVGPTGEEAVPPGDARAMTSLIQEVLAGEEGFTVRQAENGFAVVERPPRGNDLAYSAHRQDPDGGIHLHFFFDPRSPERTLLPRLLRGVGPLSCRKDAGGDRGEVSTRERRPGNSGCSAFLSTGGRPADDGR